MGKILLVDDDPSFQFLVRNLFRVAGHEVIAAQNSDEGLQMAREQNPDLILLDVRLPGSGMDGWQIAEMLKSDPAYQHIPIILVTASYRPEHDARAAEIGCETVFMKPFDVQEFRTFVQQYL